MKKEAQWCGIGCVAALAAGCALSASGLLYGTRWALLLPGLLLGLGPGLSARFAGEKACPRGAALALGAFLTLGALLTLGVALLGGPLPLGMLSLAFRRPQMGLAAGLLLGSALSVKGRSDWIGAALLAALAVGGLTLSAAVRALAALALLLPLGFGLLLPMRAAGRARGICLGLGLALLLPVGLALLGQLTGAREGLLAALNTAFFRQARMENVSACLLAGAGMLLRAA